MTANPLAVAARGKGLRQLAHRVRAIAAGYGPSPRRMQGRLAVVLELVEDYGCPATLPITASALARNGGAVAWYASRGVEFAIHGYRHVDHTALPAEAQTAHVRAARDVLRRRGLDVTGFRAPYLRWDAGTLAAVRASGLLYDSSQAVAWPVDPALVTPAYRRLLAFSSPLAAERHPVLPRRCDGVVVVPYCLPDDEAVVERLHLDAGTTARLWTGIQRETYRRGELFSLGVHPERVERCREGIEAVLRAAAAADPPVWMARLGDVARWWVARAGATVTARPRGTGRWEAEVSGPPGVRFLARGLDVEGAATPWADGYHLLEGGRVTVRADRRPFVGVHPSSDPALARFLREQGYVVEEAAGGDLHAYHVHRETFAPDEERSLLEDLEGAEAPLLRLGRWPGGARSAFCLTGDVDALTLWDYLLRFAGR